jgi:hypothetical protein
MRKATRRSAELIRGPRGDSFGYVIDLRAISVAEENLFYNYDDSEPATVVFKLSNKNELTLYFPEQGSGYLIPDAHGKFGRNPFELSLVFQLSYWVCPDTWSSGTQ